MIYFRFFEMKTENVLFFTWLVLKIIFVFLARNRKWYQRLNCLTEEFRLVLGQKSWYFKMFARSVKLRICFSTVLLYFVCSQMLLQLQKTWQRAIVNFKKANCACSAKTNRLPQSLFHVAICVAAKIVRHTTSAVSCVVWKYAGLSSLTHHRGSP